MPTRWYSATRRGSRSVTRQAICRSRTFSGRRAWASTGMSLALRKRKFVAARASLLAARRMCGSRTRSATPACSPASINSTTRPRGPSIRIPIATSLRRRHGSPRRSLRAGADQLGLQVPADLAKQCRCRSAAAGEHHCDGRVSLQQGRQRRLLHQRESAGGAERVRRPRQPAALGESERGQRQSHLPTRLERHGAQEPETSVRRGTSRAASKSEPRSA